MTNEQETKLLKALDDFCTREYDNEFGKIPENNVLPIAYTTYEGEEDEHEIQVNFNLNNLRWENYIDNKLVLLQKRDSIEEFIEEIEGCDFSDVIRDCMNKADELYGKGE